MSESDRFSWAETFQMIVSVFRGQLRAILISESTAVIPAAAIATLPVPVATPAAATKILAMLKYLSVRLNELPARFR
jgi:hypothetical protein